MDKIKFEDRQLVKPATVTIDNVIHQVEPAVYEGTTPVSSHVLNLMQDNIEKAIDENQGAEIHKYTLIIEADTEKRSRSRITLLIPSRQ